MTSRPFDLWRNDQPLVLASSSATRLKLLTGAGIACRTISPNVDERLVEAPLRARGASGQEIAAHLARAKSQVVSEANPSDVVIGADQTLAVAGQILAKPASREEAATHLRLLSGCIHELHSAVAVSRGGAVIFETIDTARLHVRVLSEQFIETYLDVMGERALSSVGGYQVEGLGVHLFEKIEGDHSTILGLPILPVLAYFRGHGLVVD
jgi:septum formation protein